MSVKSKGALQTLVIFAWDDLMKACRDTPAEGWLDKALDAAVEVEAEHRRFMGRGTYALSVERAARYSVCSRVGSPYATSVPVTWADFCGYRRDIPLMLAVKESLVAASRRYVTSREFQDIDYAGDIARR